MPSALGCYTDRDRDYGHCLTCARVVEGRLEVEQQATQEQRPALTMQKNDRDGLQPNRIAPSSQHTLVSCRPARISNRQTKAQTCCVIGLGCFMRLYLYAVGASSVLEEGLLGLVPVVTLQLLLAHQPHQA